MGLSAATSGRLAQTGFGAAVGAPAIGVDTTHWLTDSAGTLMTTSAGTQMTDSTVSAS